MKTRLPNGASTTGGTTWGQLAAIRGLDLARRLVARSLVQKLRRIKDLPLGSTHVGHARSSGSHRDVVVIVLLVCPVDACTASKLG